MYQILHSAKYWSLQKIQRFSKTNILTFEGIETEIDSTSLTHFQLYYKFLSLLHCDVTTVTHSSVHHLRICSKRTRTLTTRKCNTTELQHDTAQIRCKIRDSKIRDKINSGDVSNRL
jgi:hypothetical protein